MRRLKGQKKRIEGFIDGGGGFKELVLKERVFVAGTGGSAGGFRCIVFEGCNLIEDTLLCGGDRGDGFIELVDIGVVFGLLVLDGIIEFGKGVEELSVAKVDGDRRRSLRGLSGNLRSRRGISRSLRGLSRSLRGLSRSLRGLSRNLRGLSRSLRRIRIRSVRGHRLCINGLFDVDFEGGEESIDDGLVILFEGTRGRGLEQVLRHVFEE